MDVKLFDKRVVMRNIDKGTVSREDYKKHLESLEDLTEKCEEIEASIYDEKEEETSEDSDSKPAEEAN